MNHIGIWKFHSIGVVNNENKLVYLNAEEYINSPMPYIDESDEDAVADEMKERHQLTGSCIEVCEDGKLYMLHASSRHKRVLIEPEPLHTYMMKQPKQTGIMVVRGGIIVNG